MGKDTVNPIGAMLSAATLLAHLGLVEEATKLRVAIRSALDRAALERMVRSIRRVLDGDGSTPTADATRREPAIEIEASFDLGVVHVATALCTRLGIGQAIAALNPPTSLLRS